MAPTQRVRPGKRRALQTGGADPRPQDASAPSSPAKASAKATEKPSAAASETHGEDDLNENEDSDGAADEQGEASAEPTIADKLKSLHVQPASQQQQQNTNSAGVLPVPSTSLAQTLVQALHSSDARLLDSCLVHSKENLVKNSVKRLPSALVLPLVDALVARLGRSGKGYGAGESGINATRGRGLIEWLRIVLVIHAAHLVTIPSLQNRLAALHRTVESRLQLHQPLLQLQGRLDLVVSQIELRREAAQAMAQSSSAASSAQQPSEAQIVVEGAESSSSSSSSSDAEMETGETSKVNGSGKKKPRQRSRKRSSAAKGAESEEEEDPEAGDSDEGSVEDVMLNGHISDQESDEDGEPNNTGLSGFLDLEANEDEDEDEEAEADSEVEGSDRPSDDDEDESDEDDEESDESS